MKLLQVISAILCFFGCINRENRGELSIAEADSNKSQSETLRDSALEAILVRMYSARKDELLPASSFTLLKYHRVNDSITYCVFELRNGLCLNSYLAVQSLMLSKEVLLVGQICDADLSIPEYTYSEVIFDKVNEIRTAEYTERADSSYLMKEGEVFHFKDGYDMDNVRIIHDTSIVVRSVQRNGEILVKTLRPGI